jgi:hypothetical protein
MGWISYDLETRAGRVYRFGRAGVSFRNHQSFHWAGDHRRLLAPVALWLDARCARGCRVRCDDVNGVTVDTNESIAFVCVFSRVVDVDASPGRRRWGTRGMRSGSGIDRIKGVSRVGKNPQPAGWWSGQFFF